MMAQRSSTGSAHPKIPLLRALSQSVVSANSKWPRLLLPGNIVLNSACGCVGDGESGAVFRDETHFHRVKLHVRVKGRNRCSVL